jgi:hypothetical protein
VDIETAIKPQTDWITALFDPANGVLLEDDTIGTHDRLRSVP